MFHFQRRKGEIWYENLFDKCSVLSKSTRWKMQFTINNNI